MKKHFVDQYTSAPWEMGAPQIDGHHITAEIKAGNMRIHIRQSFQDGQDGQEAQALANLRIICAAPAMHLALWSIQNLQIKEETDRNEALRFCMSIAAIYADPQCVTRTS